MQSLIKSYNPKEIIELFDSIFSNTSEGIIITDKKGKIQAVNKAFTSITQYTSKEAIGKEPSFLQSGRHDKSFYKAMWAKLKKEKRWTGKIWDRRKNGEVFLIELTIVEVKNDKNRKGNYIGIFNENILSKDALTEKENRDPLTNLPNRMLFQDHFKFMLAHARRNNQIVALLFLDIDRFKIMNDTLGYGAGDEILITTAERLKNTLREVDSVFRLGNDEFAIILEEVVKIEDAALVAKRILEAFSKPFSLECYEKELFLSASIGISMFPKDASKLEELIKYSEIAMYQAKKTEQNNFQHYSPSMDARSLEHLTMEHQLHKALEQEEFCVYYQPIYNIKSKSIIGAEALARWIHPELGFVPPSKFIPLAEETGLIIPIGEHILSSACKQTKEWHEKGFKDFHIFVNLSARQFEQYDLVKKLEKILKQTNLTPNYLELEITESIGMRDAVHTIKILEELKSKGIHISIDDFGTGHSSLGYLKKFPIDTLKIDQSFISDMEKDHDSETIVSLIISMAHTLSLKVIAEGVETKKQLSFLKKQKCDMLQGYLFSKPLPEEEFVKLLEKM
jgi:diguanylate cyclase (GGDEF)-like protein/PAS domain S-box-containing protein